MKKKKVVIKGIGIIYQIGEGVEENWNDLQKEGKKKKIEKKDFEKYKVKKIGEVEWRMKIKKSGDKRKMEKWKRIGKYEEGIEMKDEGMKGDEEM